MCRPDCNYGLMRPWRLCARENGSWNTGITTRIGKKLASRWDGNRESSLHSGLFQHPASEEAGEVACLRKEIIIPNTDLEQRLYLVE